MPEAKQLTQIEIRTNNFVNLFPVESSSKLSPSSHFSTIIVYQVYQFSAHLAE